MRDACATSLLDRIAEETPHGQVPAYRLGRQYAACIVEALVGHTYVPSDALHVGEAFLGPVLDMPRADDVRDFVAGLVRGIESAALSRDTRSEGR